MLTLVENQPGYHSIMPAASAKFKGWSEQPDLVLNEIIERFGNNVTVVCNERAAEQLSFSLKEPREMGICQSGRYFDSQGNSARLYVLTAPGKKIMNNYLIGQKLALLPAA